MITAFIITSSYGQSVQNNDVNCEFKSNVPEVMAPNEISLNDRHEFGVTLNRDCSELFVGIEHGEWVINRTL